MNIKYILSVFAIVAFTQTTYAQYSQDAIRFSNTQTGSTSRIKALGNAGTAVGGDLSNITGNPAGLGFFTKSELSITPEFNGAKTKSLFYGQNNNSTKNSGNLNNASVVLYTQLNNSRGSDKTKGWLSLNFGANYARTNNFYDNAYFAGRNSANGSSIADYFSELATNSNAVYNGQVSFPSGSKEAIAANQGLITATGQRTDANGVLYNTYSPTTAIGPAQATSISRTGGQSDYGFAMGANYSNKLYLGIGINFTDIRYNSTSLFTENGTVESSGTGYTTNYETDQSTKGTGFNARIGAIYKPVEAVRIGASITTPTWYTIDDNTFEGVSTRYSGQAVQSDGQSYGLTYNLRTPFKAAGGLAVFLQHYGFITGDVEYVDYKTTHLSGDYDFTNDNADIKQYYRSTLNAHVGAEARITPGFYLRGGYGVQGSPQKDLETSVKTVSGGLGFRFGTYYIDATYSHANGTIYTQPYLLSADYVTNSRVTNPYADLSRTFNNVFLTLGVRF